VYTPCSCVGARDVCACGQIASSVSSSHVAVPLWSSNCHRATCCNVLAATDGRLPSTCGSLRQLPHRYLSVGQPRLRCRRPSPPFVPVPSPPPGLVPPSRPNRRGHEWSPRPRRRPQCFIGGGQRACRLPFLPKPPHIHAWDAGDDAHRDGDGCHDGGALVHGGTD